MALPQISAVIAFERRALGDQMADGPVRAVDDIVAPQRRADADRDRFLALALMERPRHGSLQEQLIEVLLVAADQRHQTERFNQPIRRGCCIVRRPLHWGGLGRSHLRRLGRKLQTHADEFARGGLWRFARRAKRAHRFGAFVGQFAHRLAGRAFGSSASDHLRQKPIAECFHFTRRLVGLHDEQSLAGLDRRAFRDEPLDDLHVAAGGAEPRA